MMALITSDCGTMLLPDHQMALITSDCVPFRAILRPTPPATTARPAPSASAEGPRVAHTGRQNAALDLWCVSIPSSATAKASKLTSRNGIAARSRDHELTKQLRCLPDWPVQGWHIIQPALPRVRHPHLPGRQTATGRNLNRRHFMHQLPERHDQPSARLSFYYTPLSLEQAFQ